jgi:NADH-quinone oxidoreductase subunit L
MPLLGAALVALLFRGRDRIATFLSVGAAAVAMLVSLGYLLLGWDGGVQTVAYEWLRFGEWTLSMSFLLDPIGAPLLAIVAFIGFWIHVFSVGYMDDDRSKARFFGALSFFMFSMFGIVLSGNLFMMFVFWELVGFSSYMLIAHYWDKDYAAEASKKAFVANRVGDLGFLVGIVWAYHYFGTADILLINALIDSGEKSAVTGMGLCLMCGFIGKSAQFPLQVWLTDAMAGPTPVSALIHAATMVAAGIFLLVRIDPMLTPTALTVILWLGALMVPLAGFWALGQTDIKKTLAYSTLSHLGYMTVAVGLGYPGLAMMHLAMHACFKATLFLCAGSIIHACHHEQDMFRMGGLWRKMPITFAAFVVALLANCAIWPFAGYFSKEGILGVALAKGIGEHAEVGYLVVFVLIFLGAIATALYMGRMLWVIFFGKPNTEAADHARESSLWMTLPLIVLGILLSTTAGWFVKWLHWPGDVVRYLAVGVEHAAHTIHEAHLHTPMLIASSLVAALGLALTFFFYGRGASEDRLQAKHPRVYGVLEKHGWFDDAYGWLTRNVHDSFLAKGIALLDLALINGLLVQGFGALARLGGTALRGLQSGSVHGYVFWFAVGLILYGAYAFGLISY